MYISSMRHLVLRCCHCDQGTIAPTPYVCMNKGLCNHDFRNVAMSIPFVSSWDLRKTLS